MRKDLVAFFHPRWLSIQRPIIDYNIQSATSHKLHLGTRIVIIVPFIEWRWRSKRVRRISIWIGFGMSQWICIFRRLHGLVCSSTGIERCWQPFFVKPLLGKTFRILIDDITCICKINAYEYLWTLQRKLRNIQPWTIMGTITEAIITPWGTRE